MTWLELYKDICDRLKVKVDTLEHENNILREKFIELTKTVFDLRIQCRGTERYQIT
jgi:hypothetical protein